VEDGAYISAGTCKGSGHHRSVLSLFAGEFVWDPDYDDGQSCSDGNDTGFNLYQIIVDRRRFQIPDRFWFSIRDLKSTLGDRGSGHCPITTTHAWIEGWDYLRGEHGVGRATLTFMPLGGRRIFL
jgi:hypothetical protein